MRLQKIKILVSNCIRYSESFSFGLNNRSFQPLTPVEHGEEMTHNNNTINNFFTFLHHYNNYYCFMYSNIGRCLHRLYESQKIYHNIVIV